MADVAASPNGPAMSGPPAGLRDNRRALVAAGLLAPGIVVLLVALVAPFLMMLATSIQDQFPDPTGVTLDHYAAVVSDPYLVAIMVRTFLLAVVVTVLTAILGYPAAWFLARTPSRWKHVVFLGIISPLLVSVVVRTIGWTIILGNEGLVNNALAALGITAEPLRLMDSFWSVTLGLVHVLLPFMILSIASVLGKIDPAFAEAAFTLGANPVRAFTKVVLPLSIQGIATGSVIVFCLTIGSYITPIWLGRGFVTVLAIAIYDQMVTLVDWPTGAAMSMIVTAGTLAILAAYGLLTRRFALR